MWPCIVTNFFLIKPTDALISQIYFVKKFYMFRAVPLPIIRSFPVYIRHWYMPCKFDDSFQARPSWSCLKAVIKPAWHVPVPNVQWKTPDDGQRNCPRHVEFLGKNKFGKLVRLLVLLKRKNSLSVSQWLQVYDFWLNNLITSSTAGMFLI
jgi:hypothetical protein